ncbi:MAG TPA: hypothetical protein VFM77_09670 [Terriglobales bacterium]|nr:hypothetical protein [Terriglobales bacterium]
MILSGWKEIAGYLHCGVRTVQRWEADGLPVHRPSPAKRSHVIAHSEELDRWVRNGCAEAGYPHLTASIAQATKLQDQARTRLEELYIRVSTLRDTVIELQARQQRKVGSLAIGVSEIYEAEPSTSLA